MIHADILRRGRAVVHATILFILFGCSGDPGTGPADITWDRDVCARCPMVISDRRHAAQVRVLSSAAEGAGVYHFDDLGCAVIWLDGQDLPARDIEIWVTDHRDGRWIDAHSARYVTGNPTPMQYGISAVAAEAGELDGSLDFAEAQAHIRRVERENNVHGGNLDRMSGSAHDHTGHSSDAGDTQ
jgi:copper chaperone NosL